MTTLADYREERIRKLNQLKDRGIDPYPAKSFRDTKIGDVVKDFDAFNGKEVTLAGRIIAIRSFGKLAFIKIRDYYGEIQIFMKKSEESSCLNPESDSSELNKERGGSAGGTPGHILPKQNVIPGESAETGPRLDVTTAQESCLGTLGIKEIKLLDTGDFIEVKGKIGKSQTGELSIFADKVRLLAKALRPLPGHDGLTNKEERYRRRYVDMNVNPEVRERMVRRSKFWAATRKFMVDHGFIEINIPVLEHTTGGADATPFVTHINAYDEDLYLRISHELPLKRLLGAGFEKVFDIGPRFRNEGVDDEHLPEHIAFESYAAYEDYEDGMNLYEEMIKYVAKETWGTLKFHVNGFDIDLDKEWPRIKYADLLKEKYNVDVFNPDPAQLQQILKENNVELGGEVSTARMIDNVWKLIRKTSPGPYWLIHEPTTLSPLAKVDPDNPLITQRFHPIIAGTEMGNGFSELNDPLDQLARFKEQQAMRDAGDDEAQMLDTDFVEMLEYGMPPACGWGNSERNFWLLEGVPGREAIPFPLMKRL